jgi:hypothetical protein
MVVFLNEEMHAMRTCPIKILILLIAIFVSVSEGLPSGLDRVIYIKILDADTNRPVKRVRAGLNALDKKGWPKTTLNAETGAGGIAVFHLGDPVPERFELIFAPDEFGLCSNVEFSTDEVLGRGVVSTDTCKSSGPKYSGEAKPGQLIVFGKKVGLWERIFREIP